MNYITTIMIFLVAVFFTTTLTASDTDKATPVADIVTCSKKGGCKLEMTTIDVLLQLEKQVENNMDKNNSKTL